MLVLGFVTLLIYCYRSAWRLKILTQAQRTRDTHRHNFPNVFDSSALWSWGYWSASFRLAAWAHTINAFMGLLTWAALLSPEPLQFEDIIFIGNDTPLYKFTRTNWHIKRIKETFLQHYASLRNLLFNHYDHCAL